MQSQYPLLVFAQSGRFIAQSATQAGYTVRVADCFGDEDLLPLCDQYIPLPSLALVNGSTILNILTQLSRGERCFLICGTGIERFYSILNELPSHIQHLGNCAETFSQLRQPSVFFSLLKQHHIPYPKTVYEPPLQNNYLMKVANSYGGRGVSRPPVKTADETVYFQQYIDGESGSVTFVANGKHAYIMAINLQRHNDQFVLTEIQQPHPRAASLKEKLVTIVQKLAKATALVGLNSLDFIVDKQGQLYVLEVNPRISASVELLLMPDIITLHTQACMTHQLEATLPVGTSTRTLRYLFAEQNLIIAKGADWHEGTHDIPHPGTQIKANEPICTLFVESENLNTLEESIKQKAHYIQKNCVQAS
jgi:predicted ATP-grasp superfamily ATP-dependent carboligase